MATRCNCDASCGENRYHDVGSSGCRFDSEEAYESYWRNRKPTWVQGAFAEVDKNSKTMKEWLANQEAMKDKIKCNCDHQFDGGEPLFHVPGGAGCRFNNDAEYNAYHDRMKKEFPEMYDVPLKQVSATRPWGRWEVLDVDQGYKVKRLEILPDQAISLQYHNHRSEHWTIVQGEGKVIVDGNIFKVVKGESFFVPKQSLHKITNTHLHETLIAIEVQMGEICSEDDIVRC